MTEAKLNYIGPLPKALTFERAATPWWRRLPIAFLLVVVLPTTLAAIYFLFIASPLYVSESRFIVRIQDQTRPSMLGSALETVGLSTGSSDAYAVHEYITSRDAAVDVNRRFDLGTLLSPRGADAFSRYPRPWESVSREGQHRALNRFITVGYDSGSGISTLRVKAFRAEDSQAVSELLLNGGERLINRLNERSEADAVAEALRARDQARERLSAAQRSLSSFRNRERFLTPELAASEGSELIASLVSTLAGLRAERAQLAAEAPNSPQLPSYDGRIRAYEAQLAAERTKMAGASDSLAPKISVYEELVFNRELADRELTLATTAVLAAEQEARRQKLYLERIVSPSLPDKATEPRRVTGILTVLLSTLLAYGVGWLIVAGVREHRQH